MNPHVEIESTRSAALALQGPNWGWEIPVYLFLGGLVAGLLLAVSVATLARGPSRVTEGMRRGLLSAPVFLSLGMGALFLDLTYKVHVFRFYTAFRPAAPMSWGSWILLLVYPVLGLLALGLPASPLAGAWREGASLPARVARFAERHLRPLAWAGVASGAALGVYTGVLLSAASAQPLWSSGALGVLFLTSGASSGVAALLLVEREHEARDQLARADIALISIEVVLVGLWLAALLAQGPLHRAAAELVLEGRYAPALVGFVLFGGLLLPAVLEGLALRGRAAHARAVPALVLLGGFLLRVVIVYAGQATSAVLASR